MKPGILSPDFWYKLKVTHFLLKILSDPGIFSDRSGNASEALFCGEKIHTRRLKRKYALIYTQACLRRT